jgi:amino acid adenylation domain-containing protein
MICKFFVEYDATIYSKQFLMEFLCNFENFLNKIVNKTDQCISKVPYHSQTFYDRLSKFNATKKEKVYVDIQSHFEKSVSDYGENLAVIYDKGSLTYKELNEKANQLAWWLHDTQHVLNNQLIAFSLERSPWQLITMLGILKAGAAFLPIDIEQPQKRKEFIIRDADPLMLITDQPIWQTNNTVRTETIEAIEEKIAACPKTNPEHFNEPEDLAYAIYTSGSTGTPKGVMIPHKGNINMVTDQVRRFKITDKDRCLQFASVSFDASVYEIFIGLYSGASIVMLTKEIIADPRVFTEYINEKEVTFATLPPVYLSRLNKKALTKLKVLVTAGEAPNLKDAKYLSKHVNYFNAYGPTEYSVCASVYKVTGDEKITIPIGAPLDNTSVYVLDEAMNLLPVGCWGELYLSGTGTALGYINRPDENEQRFLKNPFDKENKLYKTGDIARWNSNGYVEFKGRKDDMLKIRGYRIEVAEIEHAIMECDQINQAVIQYDKQRQLLIAHLIADNNLSEVELRSFLKERIPSYMIPSIYCFLESIPLTTNGKVDHKALSELAQNAVESRKIMLPENKTEQTLRALWAELLNKEEDVISTHDNFFDYGGHSILAMKLTGKIWDTFKKDISIRDFLKNPTIKGLAYELATKEKDKGLLVSLNQVKKIEKELFMIPPVLGSSTVFRNLAVHFENCGVACYGVQYRGFDYEDTFDESIEIMASSVMNEIEKLIRHDRHVFIAGYSMGAVVAAELTSMLEDKGFKVSLILIDKMLEDGMGEFKNAGFNRSRGALSDLLLREHMQGLQIPNHNLNRIRNLLEHNINLLESYRFNQQLNADILAIEAKESDKKGKMRSWENVTNGALDLKESGGNHFTIIDEVNAPGLFENMNEFINRKTN